MVEAEGRVSDEAPAPALIVHNPRWHYDSAGFQAAINGEPFEDRSGGVRAHTVRPRPTRTRPTPIARAESLLRSWLTPEQLEDWVATRNFTVRGGSSGRRYRVGDCGCYELGDDGQNVAYLCFGPADYSLPSADRVLAKKLALECDEETVLRVAGRTPTAHGVFTFGLEQQAQMAAMTAAVFYQGAGAMQAQALAQQQAQALQNAAYAGIGLQQARMNVAHAEALLATTEVNLAAFDAMQARASADRQRRQRLLDNIAYSALIVVGLFAFFASILLF